MICFDVRERGETFIAVRAPALLTALDFAVVEKTGLPFGEGLSEYSAIVDLCDQLDRPRPDAQSIQRRKQVDAIKCAETMAVHHSREILGQNRRIEKFIRKCLSMKWLR